jgi:hypothetical protein
VAEISPERSLPPTCELTRLGTDVQGRAFIEVTVQNTLGLVGIVATLSENAAIVIPPFATGATDPVRVTAAKLDQTLGAQVALSATDTAGSVTDCDPVVARLSTGSGAQVFTGLPQAEHVITVHNGTPGLTQVRVIANGHRFTITGLHTKETRSLDVAAASRPGIRNTIIVRGYGPPGAGADMPIWDGKGALPSLTSATGGNHGSGQPGNEAANA